MKFSTRSAGAILAFFSLVSATPVAENDGPAPSHDISVVNIFKHHIADVLHETQPSFSHSVKKCGLIEKCIHKVVIEQTKKTDELAITATIQDINPQVENIAEAVELFRLEYADVIEEIHERGAKMGHACGKKLSSPNCIKGIPDRFAEELEAESQGATGPAVFLMGAKERFKELFNKGRVNLD